MNIENMIYEIRGQQVMLDFDLAKLYECKNGTKEINQAVKNNLEKFPERFSWILEDEEKKFLRSKFLTTNYSNMSRSNPRAFTEQGVAMLATILKTPVATKITISIMDTFVMMRHYIGDSDLKIINIESKIIEHDNSIKLLQESFDELSNKKSKENIFFAGQIYDAYSKILDIFKEADDSLIIIDNYADKIILDIIKELKVKVVLITKKNNLLKSTEIDKYNKQYSNLRIIYDDSYHDRYFIIDRNKIYHCGTSINKIGNRTFSITLLSDKKVKELLIKEVDKIIK